MCDREEWKFDYFQEGGLTGTCHVARTTPEASSLCSPQHFDNDCVHSNYCQELAIVHWYSVTSVLKVQL